MACNILLAPHIAVFTDGSSYIDKNTKKYEASSGYLITIDGVEVFSCQFYHNNGTNSIGEVYAMIAAMDKVAEIKRDNPKLKDHFTYFISDSQYVINSLTKFIYGWKKQGMNNIWKGASGDIVKYQSFFKYVQQTYLDDDEWFRKNMFLHIKGHMDKASDKEVKQQYQKFINFNKKQLDYKSMYVTHESFYKLIEYNTKVDFLADEARINHIYYNERRIDDSWEIKVRKFPIRRKRVVIRSRNGSKF